MEFTQGGWLWDYTRFSFNFEGRIALNPSIRFGIGGMVFLYLLQPLFKKADRQNVRPDIIYCQPDLVDTVYCRHYLYILFLKRAPGKCRNFSGALFLYFLQFI